MKIFEIIVSCCILLSCINDINAGFSTGQCPKITGNVDFDVEKYLGRWYEVAKFPNVHSNGVNCNQENYTRFDGEDGEDDKVYIRKSGYGNLYGYNSSILTTGYSIDNDDSYASTFEVNLDVKQFGMTMFNAFNGIYQVLDTDYTTYAVVYSCSHQNGWLFPIKNEMAWVLTRELPVSAELMANAMETLGQVTDESKLELTNWNWCGVKSMKGMEEDSDADFSSESSEDSFDDSDSSSEDSFDDSDSSSESSSEDSIDSFDDSDGSSEDSFDSSEDSSADDSDSSSESSSEDSSESFDDSDGSSEDSFEDSFDSSEDSSDSSDDSFLNSSDFSDDSFVVDDSSDFSSDISATK